VFRTQITSDTQSCRGISRLPLKCFRFGKMNGHLPLICPKNSRAMHIPARLNGLRRISRDRLAQTMNWCPRRPADLDYRSLSATAVMPHAAKVQIATSRLESRRLIQPGHRCHRISSQNLAQDPFLFHLVLSLTSRLEVRSKPKFTRSV
jgi:hypothetical protein